MLKRFILAIAILGIGFGGVIGFNLYKQSAITAYLSSQGAPPIYLNAVRTEKETWEQQLSAIGSLRAERGISIRSETDGVVKKIHFVSGQHVEAGELLVELDTTVDRATLKSATVRLEASRRDFERDRALFEKDLISEGQFEKSRSEYQSAEALVEQTEGIIDKKIIRAPFTSTAGIHNLAVGHYLAKGDNVVSLQALDTLYLDMNLPENELEKLKIGQRVVFTVPSHGEREFSGEVRFIDVQVQATTRNILVRALVDNSQRDLLPGMFASADIKLAETVEYVTVPRDAVAFSLYGETVYVLRKQQTDQGRTAWTAHRLSVTSGEVRGSRIAISGLEAGQLIALDSQHRLLEGSPVAIANSEALGLPPMESGAD